MHCSVHRCSLSLDNRLGPGCQQQGLIEGEGLGTLTTGKEDGEMELRQVEQLSNEMKD